MDELISREAALEFIRPIYKANADRAWVEVRPDRYIPIPSHEAAAAVAGSIMHEIEVLPAVDPVRHARWEQDGDGNWICTGCGHPAIPHPILHETHQCTTDYCPKCGAKMDGGEQR